MLCTACKSVFQGRDAPWYYIKERDSIVPAYQHHPSPAGLFKAATGGCHVCQVIWRKLTLDERSTLTNTWSTPYIHRFSQAVARWLWTVPTAYYSWSPIWWSKEDFGIRFQFGDTPFWKKIIFRLLPVHEQVHPPDEQPVFVEQLAESPTGKLFAPRRRSSDQHDHDDSMNMWTPHVQRLVQRWHAECTESHDYCRIKDIGHIDEHKHLHVNFQPSRILDISNGAIKLDTNPAERTEQRYASLTHRWALDPSNMPRLSDENMPLWREDIPIEILTATFRDAVLVARHLGMRYLWIDSLCIQQSGPGWDLDWQRESAVMGEIYRHAFLNIQAGRDAEHWNHGLFTTPNIREIDPFRVSLSRTLLKPRLHFSPNHSAITLSGDYSIIEEDFARDELLGNPINRRGWVLQERLLSHRILHFGAQQVFWECRQLLACETFPSGLPKTIPKTMARAATQITKMPTIDPSAGTFRRSIHRHPLRKLTRTLTLTSPTSAKSRVPLPSFPSLSVHRDLFAWFYLAELYSACSLTRETDKLVAISGLAQIFGSPTFHAKASDVVAYLRALALPRSGGAVTALDLHSLNEQLTSHHAHIGSRPKGDYLAGLWRYELIPCLLWHVASGRQVDGTPSRRISGLRAPSWSWASVNGLLHASIYQNWTQGIDGTILAEIEYASTTIVYDTNPWGQVSDGHIRLWGKVIHEKSIVWPSHDELNDLRAGVRAHMSEVTATMVRKITRNSASVARLRILRAEVLCYMDDMNEFSHRLRRSGGSFEIALLPLVGLQRRRADWAQADGYTDEIFEWHGLVLALRTRPPSTLDLHVHHSHSEAGMAERLGYFRCRDTKVFKAVLDRGEDREITII